MCLDCWKFAVETCGENPWEGWGCDPGGTGVTHAVLSELQNVPAVRVIRESLAFLPFLFSSLNQSAGGAGMWKCPVLSVPWNLPLPVARCLLEQCLVPSPHNIPRVNLLFCPLRKFFLHPSRCSAVSCETGSIILRSAAPKCSWAFLH